ncbi:MAG: thiopurine S-methyltransferase [Rhodanobacter sp.]
MKPEFWLQRWREGRTGWHRDAVMPLLEKHWPALSLPRASRVLMPLCGKSLDIIWLAAQGYSVLGVELASLAVEQFFAENHLHPQTHTAADGTHYRAGNIEIINGDVFGVEASTLATCVGAYDRAALIALPPTMRERYAQRIYARLPAGCQTLLITLEYPHEQMEGPPFSVDEAEVRRLFGDAWEITQLERHDILHSQPDFAARGVTALHTSVYRLLRDG